MKNLFDLLQRFSKSLNQNSLQKEKISKIIFNCTKVSLNPENLNLKDGVLEISSSPAIKNEIKLKEEKILRELPEVIRILYR